MAKDTSTRKITITANGKSAEEVFENLSKKINKAKKAMDALREAGKANSQEYKALQGVVKAWEKDLKNNEQELHKVEKVMKDLGGATTRQLRSALREIKKEMENVSESSGKLPKLREQFKKIQEQIDKNTGSIKKQGGAWSTAMKNLVAYVGLFGAFNMLKQKLVEIVNLNNQFSDRLADIRKVSGLTMKDINQLAVNLQKIDTRNSQDQLLQLSYAGAKLGLAQYGIRGLQQFSEAAAQLNMALHEDMGDEAITQLAKVAQVMGDMDSMGVSKALLASGSAIFDLSTKSTATGENIMEFSKRLLGLGKTANLTTEEILALGSAADAQALMPEVASTAFNKLIATVQGKYGQVAAALKIPEQDLKSLLEAGKTMDAIVMVLEKMNTMGGLNAIVPIMGDLGSEGARMTNVFASMAANVDMVREHLDIARGSFESATSITNEFNIQNETAQALMERANNMWNKAFVSPDNLDIVKGIAQAWYEVSKQMTQSASTVGEIRIALGMLVESLKSFMSAIPLAVNVGLAYLLTKTVPYLMGALSAIKASVVAVPAAASTAWTRLTFLIQGNNSAIMQRLILEQEEAAFAYRLALVRQQEIIWYKQNIATESEMAMVEADLMVQEEALAAARTQLASATGVLAAANGQQVSTLAAETVAEAGNMVGCEANSLAKEKKLLATEAATVATSAETQTLLVQNGVLAKNTALTGVWKSAWKLGVIAGAITTLSMLIDRLNELNKAEQKVKETNDKVADAIATANAEFAKEVDKMDALYKTISNANTSMEQRSVLIGRFNNQFGDYMTNLINEKSGIDDIKKAYEEARIKMEEYYFYKQKQALKDDLVFGVQQEGLKDFVKLQKGNDAFSGVSQKIIEGYVKEMIQDGAKDALSISKDIWQTITGSEAPSGTGMDVRKTPVFGNFIANAGGDALYRNRDQFNQFNNYIVSLVEAMNNLDLIEKNFPGEYVPTPTKTNTFSSNPKAESTTDTSQADATAFLNNIKAFYTRQKTAWEQEFVELDYDQSTQDAILERVEAKMRKALEIAKEQIRTGVSTWNEFKMQMDKDIKEQADENGVSRSTELLDKIQALDTEDVRRRLLELKPKIKKGKVVGSKDNYRDEIFLDKLLLSLSQDAEKTANAEVKRQREVEKILMEHDYTGIVNKNTAADMEKMGAFALDDNQISTLFADDPAQIEAMLNVRAEEISILLKNAREHISDLYATDVSTEEGRNRLLEILFGKNWDQDNSQLKAVFDLYGDDMQAFYQKLIQYSDEYTEAEKKAADERKKVNTFLWNHDEGKMFSDEVIKTSEGQKKEDARQRSFGAKSNPDTPWGQVTENDPEIALFMLKLEQAQAYYNFLKEHSADEAQLAEQSKAITDAQSSLMDAIVAKAAKTAEAQRKWYKPIEQYGTALGEALTDESKSVKDATKSMINSFIDLTGEYVNQKLTQWIMTKLYNSLMASSEQELATTKQTVAVTNATTAVTEAGVEVAAGTAAGAAQTIGQLGWWGIPLVAAITAVLGGLMALAKGALSNAFSSGADAAKTNTKLVSGMLTYDEGNVQQYRGTDGQVYSAQQVGALTTGIVTSPIATTVNGQPSLVGERGPEIVVGRETTAAIMRNDPGLLSALVNYDRNYSGRRYRTYDEGNVQSAVQTQQNGANVAQDNMQLMQLMSSVLHYLQNPVAPNINMYGRGGLHEKMQKADSFMKNR